MHIPLLYVQTDKLMHRLFILFASRKINAHTVIVCANRQINARIPYVKKALTFVLSNIVFKATDTAV